MKDTNNELNEQLTGDADFSAMLDEALAPAKKLTVGDKVDAQVVKIGRDYVFLDLGTRTEGLLMREDVTSPEGEINVEPGDRIQVYITAFRDGGVLCGRRIGGGADRTDDKSMVLNQLHDAHEHDIPVEGTVKEAIKGGFSVSVLGQRAFCPISQIADRYVENAEEHVGRTYQFQIIQFGEDGRNIVVSRRRLLEAEAAENARSLWLKIDIGQTHEGVVTSIKPYGAFVDIGGLEGLLHISELSYSRVGDPNEVLAIGQKIQVSIKDMDKEKNRLSFSLKALSNDPWNEVESLLHVNRVYSGRVVRLTRFGAFVELLPGIEGLVHISQMDATKHVLNPRSIVAEGEEISVRILEIDPDGRRISLSMNTDDSEQNWREELSQAKTSKTPGKGMGTLGDLLGGKLKK